MTAMLPPHYDVAAAQSLASLYEHSHPAASAQHQAAHHASNIPHKPKLIFKMPRVVPDQKHKFENDELFRRLSRDSEVRYTGHRDRPMEERRQKFQQGIRAGLIEIAIISNGTNINLSFSGPGTTNYNNNTSTHKEIDLEKEVGKVHIRSPFILNGVCVRWKGYLDLERLDGAGALEFDEENAAEEERLFREELEKHKSRLRDFEDKQRHCRLIPPSVSAPATPPTTTHAPPVLPHHHIPHHHHHHHHQYAHQPHHPATHSPEQTNIQVR